MPSSGRGFTLLELLITLVVFAVLATVAIPNMQNYILQNRVKTGAQEMFTSLLYARSEAVKRNERVYVIPADTTDWAQGWIVTNLATRTYDECKGGQSNCFRIQQPLDGLAVTSADNQVEYRSNGRVVASTSFGFCAPDGGSAVQQRVVTTDLSGRPSIEYAGTCP